MHGPSIHPWLVVLAVMLLCATAVAAPSAPSPAPRTRTRTAAPAAPTPLRAGAVSAPAAGAASGIAAPAPQPARRLGGGACPPYRLRDEDGNVIDPLRGQNAGKPYSPRQTCGASGCHDYEKITQGYHFQQGKGEPVPEAHAARYAWVTSPGQYGGRW